MNNEIYFTSVFKKRLKTFNKVLFHYLKRNNYMYMCIFVGMHVNIYMNSIKEEEYFSCN